QWSSRSASQPVEPVRLEHSRSDRGARDGARRDSAHGGLRRNHLETKLFRPASFIETSIRNVNLSLLMGGVPVPVVLPLFLFNLRAAFISLTAIPLSLLVAVITLDRFGVTLNTLTLGGLAIAIGEVVDDAIIDVENIFRRLKENRLNGSPHSAFRVV